MIQISRFFCQSWNRMWHTVPGRAAHCYWCCIQDKCCFHQPRPTCCGYKEKSHTVALQKKHQTILFIMLHVHTRSLLHVHVGGSNFKSVDETLVCDHSNERYWAVLWSDAVCFWQFCKMTFKIFPLSFELSINNPRHVLVVCQTHLVLRSRQRTLVSCFSSGNGKGLLINIFMIYEDTCVLTLNVIFWNYFICMYSQHSFNRHLSKAVTQLNQHLRWPNPIYWPVGYIFEPRFLAEKI